MGVAVEEEGSQDTEGSCMFCQLLCKPSHAAACLVHILFNTPFNPAVYDIICVMTTRMASAGYDVTVICVKFM